MEKFAIAGALALSLLMAGHATVARADAPSPDVNAIVKAVMEDQYGTQYDSKHACWTFAHTSEQGNALTYCMSAGKPQMVDTPKGKLLYVYAANRYDIHDDDRYNYGHVDPGLMGAFAVRIDAKGQWTYQSLDNAMEFGSNGYCGCNKADFVTLSQQGDAGWLFVSGGVWQGTVVADYNIVMAHKGGFVDVSKIPQVKESAQDVEYNVKVAPAPAGTGMFPLEVTKTKGGATVKTFQVKFDPKAFAYVLPAGV
nr:hypothetical protein [Dyella sp. ASV24]